ncbi:hypothetical protein Dsin_004413 [Dipteronia sinensis]|uniref:Putative plant transposon protein domain-containing protein n=1 Tax=Dipteronia sinensis TaxID=43782 RepID=A0AAE0B9Z2_9ROSI|nr:hypothetical protein Dsin_004413 [Dipteronia sinensis]
MGWRGFARTPNKGSLELVREFYFTMNPYQFYQGVPVMVHMREVLITATKINQWFDTIDNIDGLIEGLPIHEFFEPCNGQLAADLRIDGCPVWNEYQTPILYNELKIEAAIWYLFFSFSLLPTMHRTKITYENARYLLCKKSAPYRRGWTMIPPTGNLGKRGYNGVARHRGLPPLVIPRGVNKDDVYGSGDEDDPKDVDYNEQNLGDDPDAE